jgi:hypothetical protein
MFNVASSLPFALLKKRRPGLIAHNNYLGKPLGREAISMKSKSRSLLLVRTTSQRIDLPDQNLLFDLPFPLLSGAAVRMLLLDRLSL